MATAETAGAPTRSQTEHVPCICGCSALSRERIAARDPISSEVFEYVTCGECGTERLSPRPVRSAIGRYYPSSYYAHVLSAPSTRTGQSSLKRLLYYVFFAPADERPTGLNRFRWVLSAVFFPIRYRTQLCFKPPALRRIFEFGAACGDDLVAFREMGWEVQGCEPSRGACEIAQSRGLSVHCATAEDANVQDSRYSCILMNNVFEHVHDPGLVLAKCHKALIDDGVLVLIVPNHRSISARVFGACWPGYDAPRHLWGFAADSMRRILTNAGFAIETIIQQSPTAWCWEAVLDGRGSPVPAVGLRRFLARRVSFLMLPVGVAFSLLGRGDFMRVVARKRRAHA